MKNAVILLDLVMGSLNVMVKANAILQKAAMENRDVTDAELGALKDQSDKLEQDIINS